MLPLLPWLAAAFLLSLGHGASAQIIMCPAPADGKCAACNYEIYRDPKTKAPVETCLRCPDPKAIVWTGKMSNPTPECILSNTFVGITELWPACTPSLIAYTHNATALTIKADCFEQCAVPNNIKYNALGNPIGCRAVVDPPPHM